MKTLCVVVVVVVLSLTSVCQPASLACEKLLKPPEDKSPDFSGRWHVIAMSSSSCMFPLLLNAILWPSIAMDVTAKDTPNISDANLRFKSHGYCSNKSTPIFDENNTIVSAGGSNNRPSGERLLLKHTGCPDCLVLKIEDRGDALLLLFSKRKNVTAEELKEFETQTECLGWTKPQVLNSDHDYETCKSVEDIHDNRDFDAILTVIKERVTNMRDDLLKCDPQILSNPITGFFLFLSPNNSLTEALISLIKGLQTSK